GRIRLPVAAVGDELLHGRDRPRDPAGDPGVRREEGCRRPAVPADDEAHARLDRHRGRNDALHDRVQGNLPAEGEGEHGRLAEGGRARGWGWLNGRWSLDHRPFCLVANSRLPDHHDWLFTTSQSPQSPIPNPQSRTPNPQPPAMRASPFADLTLS